MRTSSFGPSWRSPIAASGIAIGVLLLTGILVLRLSAAAASDTRSSFGWATHTLEVENVLNGMLATLQEAESVQRGYMISGDYAFLRSLGPATASTAQRLRSLRDLTRDNPAQQRRLDTLDRLVATRFALIRLGVELARAGRRDSVTQLVRYGPGRVLTDSIRAVVGRAIAAENVLLGQRQQSVESAFRRRRLAESLIVTIALLSLVLAIAVWNSLKRAERVVTICAWSKAIKYEDEWMSIETYMQRRHGIRMTHGISPQEAARLEYSGHDGPAVS